jgi:hypothetical protein
MLAVCLLAAFGAWAQVLSYGTPIVRAGDESDRRGSGGARKNSWPVVAIFAPGTPVVFER